jgi:hypothetical protein
MPRKQKTTADPRMLAAVEMLKDGQPRAVVAAKLQAEHSISRATAYRLIREAERTLPVEYHQLAGAAGMLDTLAESQRHYEAALLAGDEKEVRQWLAIVHRFQLDIGRTRPFDCWEIDQASEDAPPF